VSQSAPASWFQVQYTVGDSMSKMSEYSDDDSDLRSLSDRLERFAAADAECFLCAKPLLECDYTLEHVVPAWAQRRFDLWDQRLELINGTFIAYRQLTVPCCVTCNRVHLRALEDSIADCSRAGRSAIAALEKRAVFLWLGKILYGILYKELSLLLDRSDPQSQTIITADFLKKYRTHRLLLQEVRNRVRLTHGDYGSVFVWDAQDLPDHTMEWDLVDNVDTCFVGCRVGRVALFGALADGGALQTWEPNYNDIRDLRLHPVQFRELAAQFSYLSAIATRTPKYTIISGRPHSVVQNPLGGFSAKPLFEDFDPSVYARFLSHYVGLRYEEVFDPPDKLLTWLRGPDGRPTFMDVRA
jgi:hypothetical protein